MSNLADQIELARKAYYNGNPIMSDAVYDSLEDQLRKENPDHPLLKRVGETPTGGWAKRTHRQPMTSLNKAQTPQECQSWVGGFKSGIDYVISEKMDGISIGLEYSNGILTHAVTRGDGTIGEDITPNVLKMKGVVTRLPSNWSGHIRGEIICKKSDHKTYFLGQTNPRNTASGTAKRQSDTEQCRYLTVVVYQILPESTRYSSKLEELEALESFGFFTPNYYEANSYADILEVYKDYVSRVRSSLDYDIDGLVLEVSDTDYRNSQGDLNGRPRAAVAFKFPHEEQETTLRNIRWQVGKSGRITPVAEFDPVVLAGATVEKASLATVRQVENLRLFEGCKILVSRRGDVIPRVEANVSLGIINE